MPVASGLSFSIAYDILNNMLVGGIDETITSRTVGSRGSPRCSPFFPGVTPPTMLVPQAMDSLALAVAWPRISYEL